jgi:hypothetical protein
MLHNILAYSNTIRRSAPEINISSNRHILDELEADNFALLKEEIEFAAEKTASDFVEHLNAESKEIARGKE